jgi:putative methionine-R-sulfoxide reductase with GAF domain
MQHQSTDSGDMKQEPGDGGQLPPLPPVPAHVDLQVALLELVAVCNASTGTIFSFDESRGILELTAQVGLPQALLPVVQSIPLGKGIAGLAAERREAVQICNLQTDTSGVARPGAKQTGVSGSIAIPLEIEGKLVGVLGIGMNCEHTFTESEMEQIRLAGAAIALELKPRPQS